MDSGYATPNQAHSDDGNDHDLPSPPILDTKAVLDIDLKTPDYHVPRDERLIRLTGAHPFNCEAPLSVLYDAGFLTPAGLHYVRNHGAVPRVEDADCLDWEIEITGMVENPFKVTLRELIQDYEQINLPVTLVCAGNRRKEQNVVQKGSGFNWGAAGVSTSLWTGPLLRDIIGKANPLRSARYVCMEGADQLPKGHYGTCVRLAWAMDYDRAIMIAHKQNGASLEPDHGRPVRIIIPGVIGGRSVKWLKKLIITSTPSDNYYHIYDNRVLPIIVTPEMAKDETKWWKDERYTIYDLNVQSATVYPAHDERIARVSNEPYRIKGYAYSGGGIRVGRVEISLDHGKHWRLADIEYPEDMYRKQGITELYGGRIDMYDRHTSFCWCFWEVTVNVVDLEGAKDFVVRAMDENMNIQPRDMYWNVMSMMNNWWYRVAIIKEDDYLRFEHPTQPAMIEGGWMPRVKAAGGDLLSSNYGEAVDGEVSKPANEEIATNICMTRSDILQKTITMEEVEEHNQGTQPWFIVHGQVYDGTAFLKDHPGGAESITMVAGTDATEDFMVIHSETAKNTLATYHIGQLATPSSTAQKSNDSCTIKNTFLDQKTWQGCKLLSRSDVSSDSCILRFELHPSQTSGLPVGKHLYLRVKDNSNTWVMRAYTPVSCHRTKGFLDILIKIYRPNPGREGGKMTTLLDKLSIGDTVEMKGPLGHFEYLAPGKVRLHGGEREVDQLCMISGGSGITPCYQVLREVCRNEDDPTQVVLLNGNRYVADILLRSELDTFAITRNDRVKVWHALSGCVPPNWSQGRGRLNASHLEHYFGTSPSSSKRILLVCGPPGMLDMVKTWVDAGHWTEDVVYF
ncbi:hypothetical protein BZG36_03815 [Bifiguratus adelaidae]|uniref:Nitrate reductase [NADPH] n=1 Tax=Bifiguratus adelaidae TaxID=1938954 RepID=A0A261XZM5_9FUNG|nr:hypothetical protein BZG36_03815 [Bifiguratus adelaidae]